MFAICCSLASSFTMPTSVLRPRGGTRAAADPHLAAADAPPPAVEVYTTTGCSYCSRAKRFLKSYSLPFEERDVGASESERRDLTERTGSATLPQIFISGELIGGCDELLAAHSEGTLEPRLAAAGLEMAQVAEAEADEPTDAAEPLPSLAVAGGVLNPPTGDGEGADAAETAATLQRCMLELMDEFVSDRGVQYGALRGSAQFAQFLKTAGELGGLPADALDASTPEPSRKAFWINLYNCLVMHGTVAVGTPADAAARSEFFSGRSGVAYTVAGCRLSLDDIEHGVLRCNTPTIGAAAPLFGADDARRRFCLAPPTDPRLHFALNCGAKSCPPIKLYDAGNLEEGLNLASRAFVESDVRVELGGGGEGGGGEGGGGEGGGGVTLSKILMWYGADFGADEAAVLRRLQTFVPVGGELHDGLGALLALPSEQLRVTYREYDWGSNSAS